MKILLDEHHPVEVQNALNTLGDVAEMMIRLLQKGMSDEALLVYSKQEKFEVFLTADRGMRGKQTHRASLAGFLDAGCVIFLPAKYTKLGRSQKAAWLLEYWPDIRSVVDKCPAGHFIKVTATGLPQIRPFNPPTHSRGGPE